MGGRSGVYYIGYEMKNSEIHRIDHAIKLRFKTFLKEVKSGPALSEKLEIELCRVFCCGGRFHVAQITPTHVIRKCPCQVL